MKPTRKFIKPLIASLVLTSGLAQASDNFEQGDLALVFYQVISGVVQNNTYVVNLGQASLYRENTQNNVAVSTINTNIASSNIKADLDATFGTGWANDGTVTWLLIGGTASVSNYEPNVPGTLPVNGDPLRTTYFSKARASLDSNSTTKGTSVSNISSGNRSIWTNNVMPFILGCSWGINGVETNTATSGANLAAAILPKSNQNTVDEYLPPAKTSYFGLSSDYSPLQTLNTGAIAGTAGVEGALDLYRSIHTTVDADLTAGASTGDAAAGVPQFIGTLSLAANGDLKISGIPAAGGYSSWATTNGATGQAADLDHDNDGVSNGVEYFIGGPTGPTTGFTPLPGVTSAGSVQSVTWTKSAAYTGAYLTDFVVETSNTLDAGSWTTETLGGSVIISGNSVTFTFPAGPKKFARLRVKAAL